MNKLILGIIILLGALGLSFYLSHRADPSLPMPVETLTVTNPDGTTHQFNVEVASTPKQLEDGLMFRTQLAPDSGMLFVFPRASDVSFWMKNTLIPLDMVFVRQDGSVAKVHPNAQPQDLTPIPSGQPVRTVIELNGGRAREVGIVSGSRITSPSLPLSQ